MMKDRYPSFAKASAGEGGFIKNIILIVGALVALKYFFDFDLVDLLTQGKYREVLLWLKENIWQKFIVDMVWPFIKDAFYGVLQFLKDLRE